MSDSEGEWLDELLKCHKVETTIPCEGTWLEELLKCHKVATTMPSTESHSRSPNLGGGSESGKASPQHTLSRQDAEAGPLSVFASQQRQHHPFQGGRESGLASSQHNLNRSPGKSGSHVRNRSVLSQLLKFRHRTPSCGLANLRGWIFRMWIAVH